MTGKQITEKAARIAYPQLPDHAIERIAIAIWNASPTGELWHVVELGEMMENKDQGIGEYVKRLRNVDVVAAEFT